MSTSKEHPVYDRVLRVTQISTIYPTRTLVRLSIHRGLSRRGPGFWTDGWAMDLGAQSLEGKPLRQVLWHLSLASGQHFQPPEGDGAWV